ncbi:MAG TPA: hypothetical protein VN156_08170, partial [Pseudomonas sp.]|nr:hypothetical protein [Pseudomonas sp.]
MSFIRLWAKIGALKNKGHGIACAMPCPIVSSLAPKCKRAGRIAQGLFMISRGRAQPIMDGLLGSDHNHLDGSFNVGVQVQCD